MSLAYRKFKRKSGLWYAEESATRRQFSLRTRDEAEAGTLLNGYNETARTPLLNRKLGLAYLAAADPQLARRTWGEAMAPYVERQPKESSRERSERAFKSPAFDPIRNLVINETSPGDILKVVTGPRRQAALNYMRRLHNFAGDMGWLVVAVMTKRLWPKPQPGERRAITAKEHNRIVEAETNAERRAYYQVMWMTGGSQSDIANLTRENVDERLCLMVYQRLKLRIDAPASRLRIGPILAALLEGLPKSGPLFPTIKQTDASARAAEFWRRCGLLGIEGVSLHSYRYSWSERAAEAGYPERFAMIALGHGSKAVHRAYARKACAEIPSLEEYEGGPVGPKVVPFASSASPSGNSEGDDTMRSAQQLLAANPQLAQAILAMGAAIGGITPKNAAPAESS